MNPIEKCIHEAICQIGDGDDKPTKEWAEGIVRHCRIKGLTADHVLQGKTPAGIAAIWMHHRLTALDTPPAECAQKDKRYPLLPFSKTVHDDITQHHDGTARWTFYILLRAKADEVDADRLGAAVQSAIENHPMMAMHITEDGQQWHEPGYRTPYLSACVYEQDEYVYLSLTINRILGDATSFILLAQNIWRAYKCETLPHDAYLHYLQQYQQHTHTAEYAEQARLLKRQYGSPSYPLLPIPDSPEGKLPHTTCIPYTMEPEYAGQLPALFRRERISVNAFYCLATALAIMDYNHTNEAGLTWAYMARETPLQMTIFGSLHRDIPMHIERTQDTTPQQLITQLHNQMEQGIMHSDYPFTLLSPPDSPWHTAVNVLVQPNPTEAMEGSPAAFEFVPTGQDTESYCMLDIDITLQPLTLTFRYSSRHYTEQSIRRFAALIDSNAHFLLGE